MFASKNFSLTAPSNTSVGSYTIGNSLRFRNSVSAYLNRTPGSSSNRNTFTFSFWIKWTGDTGGGEIFAVTSGSGSSGTQEDNRLDLNLSSTGTFTFYEWTNNSIVCRKTPTQVFRDPGSWYHFVVAIDYTQAVADNRIKMYVNGSQITSFSTNISPSQNQTSYMNGAGNAHYIGGVIKQYNNFSDQYLAEFNVIDGQALTPSSFGTFNQYGVWQPIKYTGTYGTNGFYLKFNSYATAAALGTDSSGNSNTWTVNNVSVTTGATYDSMTDVPTLTSATAANYAVLNVINKGTNQTLTNGNLTNTASGHGTVLATIGVTSGKWYAEATLSVLGAGGIGFTSNPQAESAYGELAGKWWCYDNGSGFIIINQTSIGSYSTRFSAGQVWQWAIDNINGKVWIGVNNVWLNSTNGTNGDPVAGTNPTFTFTAGTLIWPFLENANTGTWNANFGQQPFTYTPPTGFVALNTYNLPTPTIPNGALYMAATTYTGTGSAQNIINTFNRASFQPDFVWAKSRSTAYNNLLVDVLRGITNYLYSNLINADTASSTTVTSLNANGFSVGTDVGINNNTSTFVAWQWKANGAGVSNTSGTITSTVSANTTAGFSIVLWTGNGLTAATVGHGLNAVPAMIICKERTGTDYWHVKHQSTPSNTNLYLNVTNANTSAATVGDGILADLSSSTTFGFATAGSPGNVVAVNENGVTNVAYCFAAIAGYSAFGSYVGNGSTDGTFVYTGFRPRFVMAKCSSNSTASTVWTIWDTSRSPYNAVVNELFPNLNSAEFVDTDGIDILSNGFKPKRNSEYANFSGWTYIYMAFAENPFKYALAR